jgi:hypothetical protein
MPKTTRRLNRGKKNKKFRSSKRQWRKRTNKRMKKRSRRNRSRSNMRGAGSGSSLPCDPTDKACIVRKELSNLYNEAYAQDMLVEGGIISPANDAILADETLDQRQSRLDAETDPQKKLRKRIDELEGKLQTLAFGDGKWNPCAKYNGSGTPPITYGIGSIGSRARAQRLGSGPIFGPGSPPESERCTTQDCTTKDRGYGSGSNTGGRCAPLLHLYTACNSGWCANVEH